MDTTQTQDALLLLDNESLSNILTNGEFRFDNLKFSEAKAILEMYHESAVVSCFHDKDLEPVMYEYLGIERREFHYEFTRQMAVGQDAIAFKRYVTPSGTAPIILGEGGEEAKKVQNVYLYCQHIIRLK